MGVPHGHNAEGLEYRAASTFQRYASRETLLALYDEAVKELHGGGRPDESRHAAAKRGALVERLGTLAKMRRGFQDQQAEGLMTIAELRDRLAELDEEKAAVSDELRAAEDEAAEAERLRAARDALAASYHPVHAEWYEDPDAVLPGEVLTLASSPETVRKAYGRYGARFEVDGEGVLTLRLDLPLGGEALQLTTSSSRSGWGGWPSCFPSRAAPTVGPPSPSRPRSS